MFLHDLNSASKNTHGKLLISDNGRAKRDNICGLRLGAHEK